MGKIRIVVVYTFSMMLWALIEAGIELNNDTLAQALEDWRYLHVNHCGLLCVNGSRVRIYAENFCENPLCFQCDCDPTCAMLDSCCPQGAVLPNGSFTLSQPEPKPSLTIPQHSLQNSIQCERTPYGVVTYLEVSTCPFFNETHGLNTYPGNFLEIREQCEKTVDNDASIDSIRPFIDVQSGLVFKNKFCAICNGYSLITTKDHVPSTSESRPGENQVKLAAPWIFKVRCVTYQFSYNITSIQLFLEMVNRKISRCELLYDEASSIRKPRLCYQLRPANYKNLNCEAPIMNLCLALNDTYLRIQKYTNIFCYLCAGKKSVHTIKPSCSRDKWPRTVVFQIPPITLLLGVSDRNTAYETRERKDCSLPNQWLDDNGDCQPALCSPGKVIKEGEKCASAIDEIRGLAYRLFVVFLSTKPQMVTTEDIQSLSNKIHASIVDISLESIININITVGHDVLDKSPFPPQINVKNVPENCLVAGDWLIYRFPVTVLMKTFTLFVTNISQIFRKSVQVAV
ncbi:hypothetical protein EGW08_007966 [Elysia chlorotica]|uniref:SMB domain-containing protein n=1 Tax=Elysia chlorotica TaxID=188477 RepID=A0A3S1A6Z6_ELYCH|nr:hypothetical protein EGW08_007966 [Elysia chlorotica]